MFLIKAGTFIQIQVPKSIRSFCWTGWRAYETKEDKLYDKEEVWDYVALHNGRDIPAWAVRNIEEFGKVVICKAGQYALVNPADITYLD